MGAREPAGPSPLVGRGDIDRHAAISRSLLGYGVIAGPLYLVSGLVQGLTRPGFELDRHDLSLLSDGPLGWIQITTFVVSGLMTIAAAVGMSRTLRVLPSGPGARRGPRWVGGYGVGLVLAGVFVADPMNGFPVGTPEGRATSISWHGLAHLAVGGLGFLCLVTGCLVLATWFSAARRPGWAWYSRVSGLLFLLAFAGIASGSDSPVVVLGFWAGVVIAWVWVAAVSVYLYRATPMITPIPAADR